MQLATSPGDADLGFTFFYSSIKPKIDALLVAVNILNGDITKWYTVVPKSATNDNFVNGWVSWRDTFYGWYKYATDRLFQVSPPMPWALEKDVNTRVPALATWRKQWEALSGLRATGPDPTEITKDDSSGTSWWLWIGLVIGGAVGALWIAKKAMAFTPHAVAARALLRPAAPAPAASAAVSGARRGRFAGAEPVVKRAKDFTETGNYEVTTPSGKTHLIYRDRENGWWYVEGPGHYSERVVGFTKQEAVARVAGRP